MRIGQRHFSLTREVDDTRALVRRWYRHILSLDVEMQQSRGR